ncbi:thiopeptide-type bacteriocin biosynthesis protein [Actinokineospora terrae]|nr:thiopeptide-type bacteriocin biosynthesis protein [Actinokineospora terrae]
MVLRVLSGSPLHQVALDALVEPTELAEAATVYQQAGQQALEHQAAAGWWQIYLQFADWTAAERSAVDTIAPLLNHAERDGLVTKWWFMRKYPCWRLRVYPGRDGDAMREELGAALDALTTRGEIARWWSGVYEAESAAFGGAEGMAIAHELFCADSSAVLSLASTGGAAVGRRELSVLLCNALMRGAGLEWYEQGDVWHRVAQERPLPDGTSAAKLTALAGDLKQLMLADTSPEAPLLRADGPLASSAAWAGAFRRAGRTLGRAAHAGTLQRGLRQVLSYLVIFHWNRLGLPARTQSILAWAARTAVLGLPMEMQPERLAGALVVGPHASPTRANGEAVERAITRFPLVSQRHFPCLDLETRVRQVRECADSCHEPDDADEQIKRACAVWNLSALIAADCGLPDLAIELCGQQFQIFRSASPLSGAAAIAALQPLVNLARLTSRSGDPQGAVRELGALKSALHNGGTLVIHGQDVDLDGLLASMSTSVESWLRHVLLHEGTRALAAAGQWIGAATFAEKYDDADDQLREARQARVIAHAVNGEFGSALTQLADSATGTTWELGVAACLRTYVLIKAQRLAPGDIANLINAVQLACEPPAQATTLFRARLRLAAIDLAVAAQADPALLYASMIEEAERSNDAFVVREVQAHPDFPAWATREQAETLGMLVQKAALGAGEMPAPLLDHLTASTQLAGSALAAALSRTVGS